MLNKCLSLSFLSILLISCANVDVKKIPTVAEYAIYSTFTEQQKIDLQKKADNIEGVRYYLPRPYIVVNQPYPIGSQSFVMDAELVGERLRIDGKEFDRRVKPIRSLFSRSASVAPALADAIVVKSSRTQLQSDSSGGDGSSSNEGKSEKGDYTSIGLTTNTRPIVLGTPYDLAEFSFTFSKNAVFPPDITDRRSLRNFYLVKKGEVSKGARKDGSWIKLPYNLATLSADKSKITYTYEGRLPGLSSNTEYQFVIETEQLQLSKVDKVNYFTHDFTIGTVAGEYVNLFKKTPPIGKLDDVDIANTTAMIPNGIDSGLSMTATLPSSVKFSGTDYPLVEKDKLSVSYLAYGLLHEDDLGILPSVLHDKVIELPQNLESTLQTYKGSLEFAADKVKAGSYRIVFLAKVKDGKSNTEELHWVADNKASVNILNVDKESEPDNIVSKKVSSDASLGGQDSNDDSAQSAESEKSKNKAAITANANSAGSDVIDVNDLFKLMYLPDYEQQYAIDADAYLGTVEADIKLKYGWMLTDFKENADNSQLADFVVETLSAARDLFIDIEKLKKGLISTIVEDSPDTDAVEELADGALQSDTKKTVSVLVRVYEKVVPGFYPILKPREMIALGARSPVSFETRAETVIEVLSSKSNDEPQVKEENNGQNKECDSLQVSSTSMISEIKLKITTQFPKLKAAGINRDDTKNGCGLVLLFEKADGILAPDFDKEVKKAKQELDTVIIPALDENDWSSIRLKAKEK